MKNPILLSTTRMIRSLCHSRNFKLHPILWTILLSFILNAVLAVFPLATIAHAKADSPKSKKSAQQKVEKTQAKTSPTNHEARFFKALKTINAKNEEAEIKMTIIEPDGSTKDREMAVRRISVGKEQRVLIRILSPADLKGMALLSIVEQKTENQWIYFPSSKQTRKVVQSDRSESGVLGSELQYADFDPEVIRGASAKLLKSEACGDKICDWVEATPKNEMSPYTKVIGVLEQGRDLPVEMEYYQGSKKIKSVKFEDYRSVAKVFRPHKISIRNLTNNRGTDIQLQGSKVNFGLKPDDITLQKISRPW